MRLFGSQRGAMFGLDARLAMVVFAVMATVAGFVAYGRIGIAKNAALIREIESYEYALNQYQTDMGTFYLFTLDKPVDDTSSLEDLTALWNKSMVKPGFQQHWHGPYLNIESRRHRTYGNWSLFYADDNRGNYCSTDSRCFVWLSLGRVPAKIWDEINSYYDERGGSEKEMNPMANGKIQADGATDPRTLIIRTVERPR
ncbi:MAG: hypothetical protein DI628_02815 [Blastochloris viridis]|uniref:Type II secretion system protein n=1 Tax=Blastochloris viridis TaxID=1079 RepID=A0A6N4R3S2_BLAVI|nr:MAG: hypothetical protein DI628_02815 [Blastochloris viridis]